jgi:hypothetical protein
MQINTNLHEIEHHYEKVVITLSGKNLLQQQNWAVEKRFLTSDEVVFCEVADKLPLELRTKKTEEILREILYRVRAI